MWRWRWWWWWWGWWRRRWWGRWGSIAQCITYQYHRALRACLQQPWRKQQSSKNICNKHHHCTVSLLSSIMYDFWLRIWKTRILNFDGDGDKDDKATLQKNIGTILLSLSSSNFFHFHFFFKGLWWWRGWWGSARVPKPESDCAKREGMRRHSGFVVRTAQWTGNSHFSTVHSTVNWALGTVHKILFERVKHLSAH